MKALATDAFGGPEQLLLRELPDPVPAADEVLIEVAYAAVNPVDWKIVEGRLARVLDCAFPLIPGWDAAGTVRATGPAVTGLGIGDRVHTSCPKPVVQHGTYAELVAAQAALVAPVPPGLGLADAAAVPLVALTAWQGLFEFAGLARGQSVLVHAGAGGVGSLAIQLAKGAGATVLTTAGPANHDYVAGLGADHVIDYRSADFVDAVHRILPAGVDVVYDGVGGAVQTHSFAALASGGTLVSIVALLDEAAAAAHAGKAGLVYYRGDGAQLREIDALLEAGTLRPPAVEIVPLAEAGAALARSKAGHVRGKIVLAVG